MTDIEETQPLSSDQKETTEVDESKCAVIQREIVHLRWRVLIFACFLTFGGYYIYDFPGSIGTGKEHSIQARFLHHGKKYNQEMNQALYSVYSWPNTVLALFGGILIDNILGLRKAMLLFVTLVTLGSVIFWIGVTAVNYPLLLVGRLVFGFGNESLAVAQSTFVSRWFKSSPGFALAFCITVSFSRVGSSFNFLFSPMIATQHDVTLSALVGVFCCCLSVLACLAMIATDVYGAKKAIVPPETKETNAPFHPRDIKHLDLRFFLIGFTCICVYCSIFPFIGIAKNYFSVKYDVSGDTASMYVSIYQFSCAGGSPVLGAIVDAVGRLTFWVIGSNIGFAVVHLIFLLTQANAIAMMAFMGFLYSFLVASLWPAVPYVVKPGAVGLAYGIMTSMQNTGLAIYPLITGKILDEYTHPIPKPPANSSCYDYMYNNTNVSTYPMGSLINCMNSTHAPLPTEKGFFWTEFLFLCTAAAGILCSIILAIVDARRSKILSLAPGPRKILSDQMKADAKAAEEESERVGLLANQNQEDGKYDSAGINRSGDM